MGLGEGSDEGAGGRDEATEGRSDEGKIVASPLVGGAGVRVRRPQGATVLEVLSGYGRDEKECEL